MPSNDKLRVTLRPDGTVEIQEIDSGDYRFARESGADRAVPAAPSQTAARRPSSSGMWDFQLPRCVGFSLR